jgi:intracellular sulfur oxidation DsrE/DsrF family protein
LNGTSRTFSTPEPNDEETLLMAFFRRRKLTMAALLAIGLLATPVLGGETGAASQEGDDRPVIGIDLKAPVKVVYQITTSETQEGVGKGLFYLKRLHDSYLAAGVDPKLLDIRAVFHGEAAVHLLTDDAWNRVRNESQGNPNTALISELVKSGVHIELCNAHRMRSGWAKSDVHPDVLLVMGAYLRIIDLQRQGYAYIRF